MATFNSVNIFGRAVVAVRQTNPRDEQIIAAPGVNGTASLDMGGRGKLTKVTGLLWGTTAADLNTAELLFESYWDGIPYVLVDSFGNSWPYVKLVNFVPQGRIKLDSKWGYNRPYEAEFRHLL